MIKVLGRFNVWGGSLFLICRQSRSHYVLTWSSLGSWREKEGRRKEDKKREGGEREEERESERERQSEQYLQSFPLFTRVSIPLWHNIILIISQKAYLQIPSHRRLRLQPMNFGRNAKIQFWAFCPWLRGFMSFSLAKYIHSIPMMPRVLTCSSINSEFQSLI